MIPGAFSFFLFIFSSPQQVITTKLEGVWKVVEDNTDSRRDFWFKVYAFESCKNSGKMECQGVYGFADEPDVWTNLLDIGYFNFGVSKKKDSGSNSRILYFDHEPYHFMLSPGKGVLTILDPETDAVLLKMERRSD